MAAKLVLQGNPREALKKIVDDYQKQEDDTRDLLLESTVTSVMEEHPTTFFKEYQDALRKQEAKIIEEESVTLSEENRKLESKILEERKKEKENYGKRWKFYIWFGLFSLMVLAGYLLFVLYRVGEMDFVKNP